MKQPEEVNEKSNSSKASERRVICMVEKRNEYTQRLGGKFRSPPEMLMHQGFPVICFYSV
jgi:hypothetical protein